MIRFIVFYYWYYFSFKQKINSGHSEFSSWQSVETSKIHWLKSLHTSEWKWRNHLIASSKVIYSVHISLGIWIGSYQYRDKRFFLLQNVQTSPGAHCNSFRGVKRPGRDVNQSRFPGSLDSCSERPVMCSLCVCVIIPSSVCCMLYLQLNVRVLREVMSCFETWKKMWLYVCVIKYTPWTVKLSLNYIIYKDLVNTWQRRLCSSLTKTSQWIWCRELMAAYCRNHMECISKLCV